MDAVLFVGHGSKDPEGNEEVRRFVQLIDKDLPVSVIETCFLEFEAPAISQGIDRCVERGASRIAVIPIILFSAGHAKIHIPAAIDEAKLKYPEVDISYGRPIGIHEQVLNILMSRLAEAGVDTGGEMADTAIVVVGRGSSDPDANSDLFKISRLLWEKLRVTWVETAFMGVTSPLIAEGVERCLKLGARRVVILPYFLFTGVLIKRMENMVDEFSRIYPDTSFTMAPYFGYHQKLQQILKDRTAEALEGTVAMNCDTCQYRLAAMAEIGHHHHHHHDHDDHHHHRGDSHHDHHHDDHGESYRRNSRVGTSK